MVPKVDDVLLAFGLCLGKGPTLDSITFAVAVAEDGEDARTCAFPLARLCEGRERSRFRNSVSWDVVLRCSLHIEIII